MPLPKLAMSRFWRAWTMNTTSPNWRNPGLKASNISNNSGWWIANITKWTTCWLPANQYYAKAHKERCWILISAHPFVTSSKYGLQPELWYLAGVPQIGECTASSKPIVRVLVPLRSLRSCSMKPVIGFVHWDTNSALWRVVNVAAAGLTCCIEIRHHDRWRNQTDHDVASDARFFETIKAMCSL